VSSAHPFPELTEQISALQASLDRLLAATEREHERAAHREAVIDRLHDDNQSLRRGELQAMLEPIRTALYRLHDMVRRESERWSAPHPPDAAHAGPLLCAIADEIAEALARTGAERFTPHPGDPFDPVRHRPVGTTQVADPALDGAVVTARTDGFGQGEQILRRAEVVIGQIHNGSRTARHNASAESI
jgi:molecular chaperone GrpE